MHGPAILRRARRPLRLLGRLRCGGTRAGGAPRGLRVSSVLFALALAWSEPAAAIMAGAPPDSPEAHVDPNTATSPWAGVGSVIVNGNPFSGAVIGPRH